MQLPIQILDGIFHMEVVKLAVIFSGLLHFKNKALYGLGFVTKISPNWRYFLTQKIQYLQVKIFRMFL